MDKLTTEVTENMGINSIAANIAESLAKNPGREGAEIKNFGNLQHAQLKAWLRNRAVEELVLNPEKTEPLVTTRQWRFLFELPYGGPHRSELLIIAVIELLFERRLEGTPKAV
ncbi:hypothetical protein [Nocardia sp. CNY236]|uniref:hypothetical protein n=1 Tax=Nocardia sp. CNY236 TaxID=1169152 RepID=UPI0003FAAE9F|nr:hypothetical protein [Nocardia sp. CNY236]